MEVITGNSLCICPGDSITCRSSLKVAYHVFCGFPCFRFPETGSQFMATPCSSKKGATKLMAVTSSNLNGVSKFFFRWKEKEISNKTYVLFPTTP